MILIADLINHFVNGNVKMAKVKKIKKAEDGRAIATGDDRVTKNPQTGEYTRINRFKTDEGLRFYRSTDQDPRAAKQRNQNLADTKSADSVRSSSLSDAEKKHFNTQRSYMLSKDDKKLKRGGKVASKAKKFAALAPPKNKITFADKIAGAKKKKK